MTSSALVIARIKAENVGSMLLIDDIKAGVIKQAVLNPTTLCMALYFCLANIPVQGLGFFLPSILRQIYPSISTIEVQLRTVPPYVCAAFVLLLAGYLSWKTQRRALYSKFEAYPTGCQIVTTKLNFLFAFLSDNFDTPFVDW